MDVIIFDLETTGIPNTTGTVTKEIVDFRGVKKLEKKSYHVKGEPIQFSALVCDLDTLKIKKVINFYTMPSEPICDEARLASHGITNEEIVKLSKKKHLEDLLFENYPEIFNDDGKLFISYNIKFDREVLVNSLARYNVYLDMGTEIRVGDRVRKSLIYNFCAMKAVQSILGLPRSIKLKDALIKLNLDKDVDSLFNSFLVKIGVNDYNAKFHDGLYDTFCTWYILVNLKDKLWNT